MELETRGPAEEGTKQPENRADSAILSSPKRS